tara:strand:- start:1903 stop:2193 length:291 start_codon:yes stop_codon:yes gene_type:complete
MRLKNNQRLGDVIRKIISSPKLSVKLDKLDAIDCWKEIIGDKLCKFVIDQKIHNGILYVRLKSSVVRNELGYQKSEFITQINQKIGKNIITDIVLK